MKVKYLHTMVRVNDIEKSKAFYCDLLGLEEIRRSDYEEGKFTLVFLAAPCLLYTSPSPRDRG